MYYIILDLEWNQGIKARKNHQTGLLFEIIEIGAVKLDKQGNIRSRFSEKICPVVYRKMNYVTRQMTHLDIAALQSGGAFSEVIQRFFAWCGEEFMFCTWGNSDLEVLQENMNYFQVENKLPCPLLYYDVQKLFSLQFADGKERRSLEAAVEQLELPHADDFHRALQDAYYTACVWQQLNEKLVQQFYSVDYYRLPEASDRLGWQFDFGTYTKNVTRLFADKKTALKDRTACAVFCNECHARIPRQTKWFPLNGKQYVTVAVCKQHGAFQSKLRVKQKEENQVFLIKTTKAISSEKEQFLRSRYREYVKRCKMAKEALKGAEV